MTETGAAPVAAADTPNTQAWLNPLIVAVAVTAAAVFAFAAAHAAGAVADHPIEFTVFLVTTIVLQLKVIQVPEEGAVSFASVGMMAAAFGLGAGAAMLVAAVSALVRFVAARGRIDRAIFDISTLALSSAAAAGTFAAVAAADQQLNDRFGPSLFAAAAYYIVNVGLVSIAMGLSEGASPFQLWKRRFRWMTPWALAAGPVAALVVVAYEQVGIVGVVGIAIAPWALTAPVGRKTLWLK